MCLKALGYNYYLNGDFKSSEKNLKELLEHVKNIPHLYIDILGYLIHISFFLGKMTVANKYSEKAWAYIKWIKQ